MYRLFEVEEVIAEMDLSDIDDDIAETDEEYQIVISGWWVHIPELNLNLHEGVVCTWEEESQMFMPDFAVTVVYEAGENTIIPESKILSLKSQVKVCKHPFLLTFYTLNRMEWSLP